MLPAPIFASLLLTAQPAALDERSRLAACLDTFVAAQQQARPDGIQFTNALASACALEEHEFRKAYVAQAVGANAPYLPADSEAFQEALGLKNRYRTAYLTALQTCRR